MISRAAAERALAQTEYEMLFAAPNKSEFDEGIRIPIYFAAGTRKWYAYGKNGKVDGYIAPFFDLEYPEVVARRIKYRGEVQLFSRNGTMRG